MYSASVSRFGARRSRDFSVAVDGGVVPGDRLSSSPCLLPYPLELSIALS